MKAWEEYQPDIEYPSLRKYRLDRQHLIPDLPGYERQVAIDKLRVESLAWFKEAVRPYVEETERLKIAFWSDCRDELGYEKFLKQPAVDAIEQSAWEAGHSGGFGEVFNVLTDLVDIARVIVDNCIKEPAA